MAGLVEINSPAIFSRKYILSPDNEDDCGRVVIHETNHATY